MKQKAFTFFLTFIVWIIFSGRLTVDVIIVGAGAALLTAVLFSDMLFRFSNRKRSWRHYLKKYFLIIIFVPVFFYEALVSAVKVSRHALERNPSFSPGIVRVKTELKNISALTLLANLITLTPGTLTLDFDLGERAYYIHWIDVRTVEEAETRREIIGRFERWLGVIFQ